MAILNNNPLVGASGNQGGYNINNSLRFRASASAYLSRTPASAGNRKTWTYSGWIKRSTLNTFQCLLGAGSSGSARTFILFNAGAASTNDNILLFHYNGATGYGAYTTPVYRDPSAWYHIVVAVDTTQATSTNRIKIYVNGVQQTASGFDGGYPAQNTDFFINNNTLHTISKGSDGSNDFIDGYQTETYFIDGSQLTPSDFGETDSTTGVWKPKAYTGTYGTNGFYLKFSDIATTSGSNAGLGKDFSGNTNYWTTNNISVTSGTTYDAMTDSPTNTSATVANYCTWNPLFNPTNKTFSDGNLKFVNTTSTVPALSTIGVRSGKWYGEFTFPSDVSNMNIGLAKDTLNKNSYVGADINGVGLFSGNGNLYYNGTGTAYGSSFTSGDIIMIAFDANNGKIWWGKNGTWFNSGNPASGTNPGVASSGATVNITMDFTQEWFFGSGTDVPNGCIANFGQRPFSYTPPTGFNRLNTFNLPTPTILQGNKYMDATLYTGNGSTQTITNAGAFKPDLVWVKSRSNAYNNVLNDSVRGSTKLLISNGTDAEQTETQSITSFNSNGFSLGTAGTWNQNASTFVGWQWQAGQGSTSSNTSGSITSTVSVNTTAGFSVVTYTGTGANATVGHGLGVAPKMIIFKVRNTTNDWAVYHGALATPATQALFLNLTNAVATTTTAWNSTAPTSSVFSVGTTAIVNGNTNTYVAYCWADVSGYSKAFSYTGNASSDGPFLYCGFRPKFILIKGTASGRNWVLFDSSRNTYNASAALARLKPNTSDAEDGNEQFDFLSNGFKIRNYTFDGNANGETYIGMAFAENPFKNSLAR